MPNKSNRQRASTGQQNTVPTPLPSTASSSTRPFVENPDHENPIYQDPNIAYCRLLPENIGTTLKEIRAKNGGGTADDRQQPTPNQQNRTTSIIAAPVVSTVDKIIINSVPSHQHAEQLPTDCAIIKSAAALVDTMVINSGNGHETSVNQRKRPAPNDAEIVDVPDSPDPALTSPMKKQWAFPHKRRRRNVIKSEANISGNKQVGNGKDGSKRRRNGTSRSSKANRRKPKNRRNLHRIRGSINVLPPNIAKVIARMKADMGTSDSLIENSRLSKAVSNQKLPAGYARLLRQNADTIIPIQLSNQHEDSLFNNARYVGINIDTIRSIWEQGSYKGFKICEYTMQMMAEDTSYKLWELINSTRSYSLHSGGVLTARIMNETLKDFNVPPIIYANSKDYEWDKIEHKGTFFVKPNVEANLREEYSHAEYVKDFGILSLEAEWRAVEGNVPGLELLWKTLMVGIARAGGAAYRATLNEIVNCPHIGPLMPLLLQKLLYLMAFGAHPRTTERLLDVLKYLAHSFYTRDVFIELKQFHLANLLVCQLFGNMDLKSLMSPKQRRNTNKKVSEQSAEIERMRKLLLPAEETYQSPDNSQIIEFQPMDGSNQDTGSLGSKAAHLIPFLKKAHNNLVENLQQADILDRRKYKRRKGNTTDQSPPTNVQNSPDESCQPSTSKETPIISRPDEPCQPSTSKETPIISRPIEAPASSAIILIDSDSDNNMEVDKIIIDDPSPKTPKLPESHEPTTFLKFDIGSKRFFKNERLYQMSNEYYWDSINECSDRWASQSAPLETAEHFFSNIHSPAVDDRFIEPVCSVLGNISGIWGYQEYEHVYLLNQRMQIFFHNLDPMQWTSEHFNWLTRMLTVVVSIGEVAFRELSIYFERMPYERFPEQLLPLFSVGGQFVTGRKDRFLYEFLYEVCGDALQPFLINYSKYLKRYQDRHRKHQVEQDRKPSKLQRIYVIGSNKHKPNATTDPNHGRPLIADLFPEYITASTSTKTIRLKIGRPKQLQPSTSNQSEPVAAKQPKFRNVISSVLTAGQRLLKPLDIKGHDKMTSLFDMKLYNI